VNEKVDPETFAEEAYRAYRRENRPFRRAFGRGERWRKLLLAVGEYNARLKDQA
jgi:hypothetical protein